LENDKEGEMRMGWYTKYFSTLMKGLGATSLKERIEARRLVRYLKNQDNDLYKKVRKKIAEHRVTSAIKDLEKLIKEVAKAAENAEKLIFNVITTEQKIVEAEQEILKALLDISKKAKGNKSIALMEREMAMVIFNSSKEADSEEREEYKLIIQIINESHLKNKQFMEALRLRFQRESAQTILTKFAIRAEIRKEKVDIRQLQRIGNDIRRMVKKVHGDILSKDDESYMSKILEKDYMVLRNAAKDAFYQSYLIKKRDLLMMLKILFNLHNLRDWLAQWAHEHNLPMAEVIHLLDEIKGLEEKISKEFQPIAQGFRIMIHSIENIKNQALADANQIRR
jgi:hypothetical protein